MRGDEGGGPRGKVGGGRRKLLYAQIADFLEFFYAAIEKKVSI